MTALFYRRDPMVTGDRYRPTTLTRSQRTKKPEEAGFLVGATLAALHPIARHHHQIGSLWRQRLARANAAALARHAGRTEDEAALRDAFYL